MFLGSGVGEVFVNNPLQMIFQIAYFEFIAGHINIFYADNTYKNNDNLLPNSSHQLQNGGLCQIHKVFGIYAHDQYEYN